MQPAAMASTYLRVEHVWPDGARQKIVVPAVGLVVDEADGVEDMVAHLSVGVTSRSPPAHDAQVQPCYALGFNVSVLQTLHVEPVVASAPWVANAAS